MWSIVKLRCCVGSVLQVAPGPSRAHVHTRRNLCQVLTVLLGRPKAAARGQHIAVVLGEALVHPKQIVLHGLLIIRRGKVRGPAILAIPRVGVFMGQQCSREFPQLGIDLSALTGAAVIGLMMLQTEMRHVVAKAEKKVVIPVMGGAE